jgi:hypothetical protein
MEPTRAFDAGDDHDDVGSASILDDLRAELATKLDEEETVTLEVIGREGYAVRFSSVIDHTAFQMWRRKCLSRGTDFDDLRFSAMVLGNQCRAIVRRGEDVYTSGEPLTFASKALHDLVDAVDTRNAIRRFYGRDSHVIATGKKVLEAAGYDREAEEAPDPTRQ